MLISVGLDLSITNTGMAVVGSGDPRGKSVSTKGITGFCRLHSVATSIANTIKGWAPDRVVIENYAFVKNISSFTRLVELGSMVRYDLYRDGIPWFDVPPTSLELWTTGKGNAGKPEMAEFVKSRWAFESTSHDIIDAFALAQMGQMSIKELMATKGVVAGK